MVARNPLGAKEIIGLLVRLKAETPEYPAQMLTARKTSFLKQAATLKLQGKGQGGEGGHQAGSGGSGGSSTALGGSTTAQGIIFQTAIVFGLVATMLLGMFTGNYLFRDQVGDRLEEKNVATFETPEPISLLESSASPVPTLYEPAMATPVITATLTENIVPLEVETDDPRVFPDLLEPTKENPGLHLGQATGTPAAPGQGNPGNVNQPDKPDKTDKPNKPGKP